MGASGWQYVEEIPAGERVSIRAALRRLRERVLASGDFYYSENEWRVPRPTTMAELEAIRRTEEFWEVGSHSILDVDRVISRYSEDRDGTVRQLTRREAKALFATTKPDLRRFAEVQDERWATGRRWSGRCQVLFEDGRPTAVGFWGFSGD